MDKDVLSRLASIEEKLDVLMRCVRPDVAVSYEIDFSTVDGDAREVARIMQRMLCTRPPIRGD